MKIFLISIFIICCSGCLKKNTEEYSLSCKNIDFYNYDNKVPDIFKENDEYFSDALFAGDSRIGSLVLYNKLSNADIYYIESLSLNMINITKIDGIDKTLNDVIKNSDKKNIYFFIGINEIGMNSFEKWGEKLDTFVKDIKKISEDKHIYLIQSYTVLSAYKTPKEKIKEKVSIINDKIESAAKDNHVYFLNPDDYLLGDDGFIKKEYVFDGIHFNRTGVEVFVEYIKNHVAGEKYVKEICN